MTRETATTVEADGRALRVSSLDRVLWPATGTTKAELLDYYVRVAPVLLPHLRDHPITLYRCPMGVEGKHFFQTRTPPHPPWLRTVTLSYARTGKSFEVPVIDDVAGLVWAAQLSTLELHPFLAPVSALDHPVAMVLDLDPGRPAGLLEACVVALLLRAQLDRRGLASYPKTSGGKGLHVFVPVRDTTYAATKALARELARELTTLHPELVVDRMTKSRRTGRVLIDWSQNDPGKSTVAPWSPRAYPLPTVSSPLTWDEVEAAVAAGDARRLVVTMPDVARRLVEHDDLFADLPSRAQVL